MTSLSLSKTKHQLYKILKVFDNFSKISGLKLNKSKCEIAGIGALKEVKSGTLQMQCIKLNEQIV